MFSPWYPGVAVHKTVTLVKMFCQVLAVVPKLCPSLQILRFAPVVSKPWITVCSRGVSCLYKTTQRESTVKLHMDHKFGEQKVLVEIMMEFSIGIMTGCELVCLVERSARREYILCGT